MLGGRIITPDSLSLAVRSNHPVRAVSAARPSFPMLSDNGSEKLADLLGQAEREIIVQALRAAGGSRAAAAQRLGIGRTKLYKKMAQYGIR